MLSGHTIVAYCIMSIFVAATPFSHRELALFRVFVVVFHESTMSSSSSSSLNGVFDMAKLHSLTANIWKLNVHNKQVYQFCFKPYKLASVVLVFLSPRIESRKPAPIQSSP